MKYGIVHYNTPELTVCLIASVVKHDANAEFYIFENSDSRKLVIPKGLCTCITLDNTKGSLVDFNNLISDSQLYLSSASRKKQRHSMWGSLKHAASVQYLIEYIKDDFILLDSDVLVRKLPLDLCKDTIVCDFLIKSGVPLRVLPFMLYLPYYTLLKNDLKFFDITRFDACYIGTDTGGSFCRDIVDKGVDTLHINLSDYIVHFGNGSWRGKRTKANLSNCSGSHWAEFLVKHKDLWK